MKAGCLNRFPRDQSRRYIDISERMNYSGFQQGWWTVSSRDYYHMELFTDFISHTPFPEFAKNYWHNPILSFIPLFHTPYFQKDRSPVPRKAVLYFFLLFSSHSKALFHSPFGSCHYPQKLSLSSEAEADPCVYPPLVRQVRAEVSRVGSVQVGVPV